MQPTESKQLPAVNSRQTLQGTDMDIKELATLTAAEMDDIYLRNVPAIVLEQYAARLIAAYLAEQEPVAWVPQFSWQRSIDAVACISKRSFDDIPLFTAPPEPAPRLPEGCMWAVTKGGHSICQPPNSFYQKSAAPSSEEVREMAERLRDIIYVNPNDAADMIERLAARVPDGCVVVPKEPTEAMILAGNLMQHGVRAAYKAMIAVYKGPSHE